MSSIFLPNLDAVARAADKERITPQSTLHGWEMHPSLDRFLQPCKATEVLRKACRILPLGWPHGLFIAGGILVRAICGINEVNDVDVFMYGHAQREQLKKMLAVNTQEVKRSTYFDAETAVVDGIKFQLCVVHTWPAQTLGSFCSRHVMVGTDGQSLLCYQSTMGLILGRQYTKARFRPSGWYEKWAALGFTDGGFFSGIPG